MSRKPTFVVCSVVMILAFVLTACQPPATPVVEKVIETVVVEKEGQTVIETVVVEKTVEVPVEVTPEPVVSGQKVLLLSSGSPGDIPTIDPPYVTQAIEIQIVSKQMVGLVCNQK